MQKSEYIVNLFRLDEGEHEFNFQLTDDFFSSFESSPIAHGRVAAEVVLTKGMRYVKADIALQGEVEQHCDRCLEAYMQPLQSKRSILFKMAEEEAEVDDETFHITEGTEEIDLASHLFDFVVLSTPMRKLHPRYYDEQGQELPWEYEGNDTENDSEAAEGHADPRWEALRKLREQKDN